MWLLAETIWDIFKKPVDNDPSGTEDNSKTGNPRKPARKKPANFLEALRQSPPEEHDPEEVIPQETIDQLAPVIPTQPVPTKKTANKNIDLTGETKTFQAVSDNPLYMAFCLLLDEKLDRSKSFNKQYVTSLAVSYNVPEKDIRAAFNFSLSKTDDKEILKMALDMLKHNIKFKSGSDVHFFTQNILLPYLGLLCKGQLEASLDPETRNAIYGHFTKLFSVQDGPNPLQGFTEAFEESFPSEGELDPSYLARLNEALRPLKYRVTVYRDFAACHFIDPNKSTEFTTAAITDITLLKNIGVPFIAGAIKKSYLLSRENEILIAPDEISGMIRVVNSILHENKVPVSYMERIDEMSGVDDIPVAEHLGSTIIIDLVNRDFKGLTPERIQKKLLHNKLIFRAKLKWDKDTTGDDFIPEQVISAHITETIYGEASSIGFLSLIDMLQKYYIEADSIRQYFRGTESEVIRENLRDIIIKAWKIALEFHQNKIDESVFRTGMCVLYKEYDGMAKTGETPGRKLPELKPFEDSVSRASSRIMSQYNTADNKPYGTNAVKRYQAVKTNPAYMAFSLLIDGRLNRKQCNDQEYLAYQALYYGATVRDIEQAFSFAGKTIDADILKTAVTLIHHNIRHAEASNLKVFLQNTLLPFLGLMSKGLLEKNIGAQLKTELYSHFARAFGIKGENPLKQFTEAYGAHISGSDQYPQYLTELNTVIKKHGFFITAYKDSCAGYYIVPEKTVEITDDPVNMKIKRVGILEKIGIPLYGSYQDNDESRLTRDLMTCDKDVFAGLTDTHGMIEEILLVCGNDWIPQRYETQISQVIGFSELDITEIGAKNIIKKLVEMDFNNKTLFEMQKKLLHNRLIYRAKLQLDRETSQDNRNSVIASRLTEAICGKSLSIGFINLMDILHSSYIGTKSDSAREDLKPIIVSLWNNAYKLVEGNITPQEFRLQITLLYKHFSGINFSGSSSFLPLKFMDIPVFERAVVHKIATIGDFASSPSIGFAGSITSRIWAGARGILKRTTRQKPKNGLIGKALDKNGLAIPFSDLVFTETENKIIFKNSSLPDGKIEILKDISLTAQMREKHIPDIFETLRKLYELSSMPEKMKTAVAKMLGGIASKKPEIIAIERHNEIQGYYAINTTDSATDKIFLSEDIIRQIQEISDRIKTGGHAVARSGVFEQLKKKGLLSSHTSLFHELGEGLISLPPDDAYKHLTRHTLTRGGGADLRIAMDSSGMGELDTRTQSVEDVIRALESRMEDMSEKGLISKSRKAGKIREGSLITKSEKALIAYNFNILSAEGAKINSKKLLWGIQDYIDPAGNARFTQELRYMTDDLRRGLLNIFLIPNAVSPEAGNAQFEIGQKLDRKLTKDYGLNTKIGYFSLEFNAAEFEKKLRETSEAYLTVENTALLPKIFIDCPTSEHLALAERFIEEIEKERPGAGKDFILVNDIMRGQPAIDEVKVIVIGSSLMNYRRFTNDYNFQTTDSDLIENGRRILTFLQNNGVFASEDMRLLDVANMSPEELAREIHRICNGMTPLRITKIDWEKFSDWKNSQEEVLRSL
ncbi:MAG: hypothetical protein ABH883_04005 [Candidatus Omnitrophota bacterium]